MDWLYIDTCIFMILFNDRVYKPTLPAMFCKAFVSHKIALDKLLLRICK